MNKQFTPPPPNEYGHDGFIEQVDTPIPGLTLEETRDWYFIRDLGMYSTLPKDRVEKFRAKAPHLFDEPAPEIQERRRELIEKMNAARRQSVKQRNYDDEIYSRAFGTYGRKDPGETWGA